MERFYSIEDAREYFSYTDEDLSEVRKMIEGGKYEIALNTLQAMTRDCEYAANQFPEMDSEVEPVTVKIKSHIWLLIAAANRSS